MNDFINLDSLSYIFHEGLYTIPEKNLKESSATDLKGQQVAKIEPVAKTEPVQKTVPVPEPEFIGKNLKNILLINGNKADEILRPAALLFLQKILQSVQLQTEDVAIVSWSEGMTLEALKRKFSPRICIGLNIAPGKLHLELSGEKYGIQELGSTQFLWTDSLEEIETDVEKKKQLWKNLKLLFS